MRILLPVFRHHDGIETMIRIQVQFSEEQIRWLKARAAQEHISVSEIVRRSVTTCLESQCDVGADERHRRAIEVVGRFASGLSDVAARHDDYLAEAYRS